MAVLKSSLMVFGALAVLLIVALRFLVSRSLLFPASQDPLPESLRGGKIVNEPGELLWAAVLVFTDIVIAFAFVYWELADGGPGSRANNPVPHPDLAFVQHTSPELARPGWRPVFVDYLYLSLTNSIAFSPTDTMPLAHWAKLVMGVQSAAALVLVGLVVAQAVNVL